MKRYATLALAALLITGSAVADTITEQNAARVAALIEAAVEAHGGERLAALDTLIVEHESINYSVGQSRGTEAPWDKSEFDGVNAIDLGDSIFVTRGSFNGGGFEGRNATIINDADSYQVDFRAGTVSRIAEPDFDTTSGPFVRVTPALLVRTLEERAANAFHLGEATIDGDVHDVIGFSMTVGPAITLYFDRDSHLLRRSERIFAAAGLVQYEFEDYRKVAGVPFNRTFKLFLNGNLNIERVNVSTRVNEPLDALLAIDSRLETIPELGPDPLTRQELADGVWLIGGSGTYAMFVDMGDYLFAAGGTAGIPERIASLREVVGDKPIRYAMLTHHHFDHVVGVPTWEAEGATVIAAAAHEKIAREAATDGESMSLKTIDDRMTVEAGDRVVEIIDLGPTAHTEHLLVAWLPAEGILFEADHFALPRVGPVPPAVTSTRSFAEALAREELRVKKIASAHSPRVATPEDLRRALQAEIFQARL